MDNIIVNVTETPDDIQNNVNETPDNIQPNITEIPDNIQNDITEIPNNILVDTTEIPDNIEVNINEAGTIAWGSIIGILSNQNDLQNALDAKENLIGFTPADELINIIGAGLLAGQGGDLTANRTFTLNNGDIDHNLLFNTHNLTTDIDHDQLLNAAGLVKQHSDIDNHISNVTEDHTQYFLLDGSRDVSGNILPNANGTLDIGNATDYFRTIYLNNSGRVIDCPTAIGQTARTNYIFDLGGGGNVATEGGDFTFQMDPCVGACENNIIFDVGNVYWAGAGFFNRFKIQSYTGLRTYAFTAAFGGFNNVNYGWELQYISGLANTAKTLFFDNQTAAGPARTLDLRLGGVDKLTIENDGTVQVIDRITTPFITPTVISNGFSIGTEGAGTSAWTGYPNFFGLNWFDYITVFSTTSNLPMCIGLFPNGIANASYMNVYNNGNTGATAWLSMGTRGSIAELVVRDFNQPTSITQLNIGSGGNDFPLFDVTCTTLIDINFIFAGVTEYNFTTTAFTLSDANNIIFGTGTGTKIGTATNQKIGFYGVTPVTQRLKVNYNNWAALSDIVNALVDLGLFDQV